MGIYFLIHGNILWQEEQLMSSLLNPTMEKSHTSGKILPKMAKNPKLPKIERRNIQELPFDITNSMAPELVCFGFLLNVCEQIDFFSQQIAIKVKKICYNLLRSQRSKGGRILDVFFHHKRDLILTIDSKTGTIVLSKERQQLFYPTQFC